MSNVCTERAASVRAECAASGLTQAALTCAAPPIAVVPREVIGLGQPPELLPKNALVDRGRNVVNVVLKLGEALGIHDPALQDLPSKAAHLPY